MLLYVSQDLSEGYDIPIQSTHPSHSIQQPRRLAYEKGFLTNDALCEQRRTYYTTTRTQELGAREPYLRSVRIYILR